MQISRYKLMALNAKGVRRGETSAIPVAGVPLADPAESPEAALHRRQRLDQLERAIQSLGERCREIFRLKLQGVKFPEMQRILGAESINTVYTWDLRCRRQLMDRWKGGR